MEIRNIPVTHDCFVIISAWSKGGLIPEYFTTQFYQAYCNPDFRMMIASIIAEWNSLYCRSK